MTVNDVEKIIKDIQDIKDQEAAHSREDELHQKVLDAIARGSKNAKELAKAALKTNKLNFGRWCA